MTVVRSVAASVLVVATVAIGAAPAFAASAKTDPDNEIVVTGSVGVPHGHVVKRVLIFDGDVRVDGRVRDWVFAFNGDVTVNGRVDGDVTALNGRVVVTRSGFVDGDVVSKDRPAIARRASVTGN